MRRGQFRGNVGNGINNPLLFLRLIQFPKLQTESHFQHTEKQINRRRSTIHTLLLLEKGSPLIREKEEYTIDELQSLHAATASCLSCGIERISRLFYSSFLHFIAVYYCLNKHSLRIIFKMFANFNFNLLPVSIRAEHIFPRFETALKTFVRQRKFYTYEEYSDYMKNL